MTDAMKEICPFDTEIRPSGDGLREAFAAVMRRRYRHEVNVQGCIVRDFGLSVDAAKGLLKEQTSIRTMEAVLHHKNGGWKVGLAVLSIVVGRRIVDFIASERNRLDHEAEQRRLEAEELGRAEALLYAVDVDARRPAVAGLGSR